MKTSTTFKSITLVALLGAALSAPVLAQGGPGMGGMGGMGAGCVNVAATANSGPGNCVGNGGAMGGGRGMGAGMGSGGGRAMMAKQNSAQGWTLMTPEERTAFQAQMHAVKTYDECVAVQTEHRGAMEVRAKDQGLTLMSPRGNPCDKLKARGLIM